MFNITFVNLQESFLPLSYAYLVSYYRKNSKYSQDVGFKVIDYPLQSNCLSGRSIKKLLKDLKGSDLVAFSTITQVFNHVLDISKEIKNTLGIPIMYGGHHISALPYTLPDFVDIAIIGEGEQTFLESIDYYIANRNLNHDGLKGINGLAYHDNNRVIVTEERKLISPLDNIPIPARDIFDKKYFLPKAGWNENVDLTGRVIGNMSLSRGCPYNCIFCSSSKHWHNTIRFFSPEYVIKEIEGLVSGYHVEIIQLTDDLISTDINRLESIYDMLVEGGLINKIEFGAVQVRANLLNDRLCSLLKKLKVKTLGIGIESGSNKILQLLKGRTVNEEVNINAVKLARKWGFNVWPQLIVGIPGETKEDIQSTLKFCSLDGVEYFQITMLTPLPGTPLWDYAKEHGLVNDNMQWDKLSLDINESNIRDRVYLGDAVNRNELWKLIKEPLMLQERKKAANYKIDLKKNGMRYLGQLFRNPQRYGRLILNILILKFKNKIGLVRTRNES